MRLLIAVKSCRHDRDRGYHNVIRETWGYDARNEGIDVLFFMGGVDPITIELDEYFLPDVSDGYKYLPFKTQGICRRASTRNYDHIYLCDTDTFLIPQKLLKCGFEQYDYYGLIQRLLGQKFHYDAIDREGVHHPGNYFPWASGGFGYFLSKKAAGIIARCEPDVWAEDVFVGQVMNEQYNHDKITIGDAKNLAGQCSWHFPAHEYNSGYDLRFNWMPEMYMRHK